MECLCSLRQDRSAYLLLIYFIRHSFTTNYDKRVHVLWNRTSRWTSTWLYLQRSDRLFPTLLQNIIAVGKPVLNLSSVWESSYCSFKCSPVRQSLISKYIDYRRTSIYLTISDSNRRISMVKEHCSFSSSWSWKAAEAHSTSQYSFTDCSHYSHVCSFYACYLNIVY